MAGTQEPAEEEGPLGGLLCAVAALMSPMPYIQVTCVRAPRRIW
jgi:hypothetical protein